MPRKPAAPVRAAVEAHVEALKADGGTDTGDDALAALALNLASLLDGGEPVMMTASWARELRATLAAMGPREVAGDGDDDADGWCDMPAPVRDAEES